MITLLIFIGILLLLIIWMVAAYNQFVKFKNRMKEAWSMIDVFLKKRHDLVPNLVEIVKGYAAHEKQTFEDVTRLRSEAMQANNQGSRIQSETGLGKALGKLLVVAENYPELKANQNFLELQRQLSEIENELSSARRYYNGTVRENNIYAESFPSNIVAGMFNFPEGQFFEINPAEKDVSSINFRKE